MLLAVLLAAQSLLVFHGNAVLVEDVYRSVLDLPANSRATEATARTVAVRLRKFLRNAGYELATVSAQVDGGQIVIDLDEGKLDKIIFVGGGAVETLRLKLDLHLPENVYNRPELERQLRKLATRVGLAEFAYEVVPVDGPASSPGPQLDELAPIDELPLFQPGRAYELHILVTPGPYRPGLSPELEITSLEGGGLGATYHGAKLFFPEDRWVISGRVAGGIRERLDAHTSYATFTRVLGDASWDSPPVRGSIRPSVRLRADLSDRQRSDLRLESFRFATLEAEVLARIEPTSDLRLSLGLGIERRFLFGATAASGAIIDTSPVAQTRPYGEMSFRARLDPGELRRDRAHELVLEGRLYGRADSARPGTLRLLGQYQKVFLIGWHELWIEGRGSIRDGDVLFPEEESIGGDSLRGPFGSDYARKLAALGVEFRYSLVRDILKLGVFHNGVVFGSINRMNDTQKPLFADAFGLGLHALILDSFSLDTWFGFGRTSDGRSDHGGALSIRQAY